MKRFIILLALMGAMLAVSPSIAMATHTGSVSATVTPSSVSISVASPNTAYGTLHVGVEDIEPTNQVCQLTSPTAAFTVTNNGTANQDFDINGGPSTPGTWTLAATADANTYVHRFTVNPINTCVFTDLTISTLTLKDNVAQGGTIPTFLQLDMPTSSTNSAQQTLPITITATAT